MGEVRMDIMYLCDSPNEINSNIKASIEEFSKLFSPMEDILYVFEDKITNALFCECHIQGHHIVEKGTIDSPLDAENQSEYRANRDVVEDSTAFIQMKADALNLRSFSNIVTEYNTAFDESHPLKIIGGQHRYIAILEALNTGVDQIHGIKVYFGLNMEQRLDVQLISNTNIVVSSDLLDRMLETVKGPELRTWCQKVGLLNIQEDFADRKQRGSRLTVRAARTFIMNYYEGKKIPSQEFSKKKTNPILAKTGGLDEDWELLKKTFSGIWDDPQLIDAGKAFALLIQKQKSSYTKSDGTLSNSDYADKASSYAIVAAWAFVAGVLQDNAVRLQRHYELANQGKPDPLNAKVLARTRHKTDPDNYRGLGTRTDAKERGRLVELFFFQAEKGTGITKELAEAAIARFYAKQAMLEALAAESKV